MAASPAWHVEGQYYENCSCDFVCPCVPGQMQVKPTKGACTFAMAFQIERGRFGETPLDGLGWFGIRSPGRRGVSAVPDTKPPGQVGRGRGGVTRRRQTRAWRGQPDEGQKRIQAARCGIEPAGPRPSLMVRPRSAVI